MPKFHVDKSVKIKAPAEKVFKAVSDLNTWSAWSPWLIFEPEAKVEVKQDGKYQSWDGKRVGEGHMQVTSKKEHETVDYDLTFLKPWKSHSKVKFEISGSNGQSQATWHMDGSLPFFMFWMKKMMINFIGMDYERGLSMLKDYLETGKVPSKLEFLGKTTAGGFSYIGVKKTCPIEDIGASMADAFNQLMAFQQEANVEISGPGFSIYHKWDMRTKQAVYTSGLPVSKIPESIPDHITSGEIPSVMTYAIKHTGPYRHLGNAWSAGYNMAQKKEFKSSKKVHPFEVYVKDLNQTKNENELETVVYFPVK